ncbi:hypothetical protein VPH35_127028 [Triticum aestivum]
MPRRSKALAQPTGLQQCRARRSPRRGLRDILNVLISQPKEQRQLVRHKVATATTLQPAHTRSRARCRTHCRYWRRRHGSTNRSCSMLHGIAPAISGHGYAINCRFPACYGALQVIFVSHTNGHTHSHRVAAPFGLHEAPPVSCRIIGKVAYTDNRHMHNTSH